MPKNTEEKADRLVVAVLTLLLVMAAVGVWKTVELVKQLIAYLFGGN